MLTFFVTLIVLLAIIAAMSVGVMMGRKPISGSCGGIGAALGEEDYECEICGGDPNKCEEGGGEDAGKKSSDLAYDAGRP